MMILEAIVNEEEKPEEHPDDVLLPKAAAAYLSRLYKRPFTTTDFRNLRLNYSDEVAKLGVQPEDRSPSNTAWRRRDLDAIANTICTRI